MALARQRTWIILALLAVAAAVYFAPRPKQMAVDVLMAQREDVQLSVVASGRVLSLARVDIGATLTGRVQKVAVREGARVGAGELLIELESSELRAAVTQARAARDRARARVSSVSTLALPAARESRTQAEWHVTTAEREYQRSQELLAKGFISQSKVDESERQLQVARSQLAAADSQMKAQDTSGAEAQQARMQVLEAEAALELAQARLTQTQIRAPAAGVVLERVTEPGDIAQPGKRMMALALDGPSRLIVQVDEKNLPLLAVGHTALAMADAFPNKRFTAVIAYISPGVDASRGTVELRLDIPQPPAFLKSDMTVAIDLTGPMLKQALLLPADAISQLQSDAPYVMMVRDGVAVRAAVRTGAQTQGRVQILDGVVPGEHVIVSRDIEAGARVRVR